MVSKMVIIMVIIMVIFLCYNCSNNLIKLICFGLFLCLEDVLLFIVIDILIKKRMKLEIV